MCFSGHTKVSCEFSTRANDKDLWSRKAEFFQKPDILEDQDESFEENLSGDEEAITSDAQLDQEIDDAIPWIQHYDDQALAQDVHFVGSTYYDDAM